MKFKLIIYIALLTGLALTLSGCLSKVDRLTTNYYILDYKKATENPILLLSEPFPKTCEVFDTEVNRTYSRNQLVVKENFSKVSYLPGDLWANRLTDAIPNLLVQRLKAYNLFRQVERSTGDISPNYYLETNLLNIEKVMSDNPRAYLRMEFKLRDAASQRVLVPYLHDSYKPLISAEPVHLVETYNEMLMEATDFFVAQCRLFMEGKPLLPVLSKSSEDPLEQFVGTQSEIMNSQISDGELLVLLSSETDAEIHYSYLEIGEEVPIKRQGIIGVPETVRPGKYKLLLGEKEDYPVNVQVDPKRRTTVQGQWGELLVLIMDQSQSKVRLGYNLWRKKPDAYDYYYYGSDTSLGDEDFGQKEKVWLLPPGTYMFKIGSGPWDDLKDFTTVTIAKGDSKLLTVIVDPTGDRNYMLGAGLLGNKDAVLGKSRLHKGTLTLDFNITASNDISEDDPSYDVSLVGRTDNVLDYQYRSMRFTARSLYSLGLRLVTNTDLRVNPDTYSLKNVVLYTPLREVKFLRNFSFYGRADVNTHFFDEILHYQEPRNIILTCARGDTLWRAPEQDQVRTKIALFPLRLKEGLGITYRWVLSPRFSASIRGGYGWQQDINKRSFSSLYTGVPSQVPGDTLRYDVYTEACSNYDSGIESTLVVSAISLLNFLTINSSIDVLFPMTNDQEPRFDSETRFNIKLYRNLSMDISLNVEYDKARKDWVVYNYTSFLRLAIFY
ncbi:MAG: membrane integrity-associated transporter subunit PqiC [Candidatus Cloacimonetes bacterium]|nr:membrane integrity-associated transporter subunit PqiC [Candidatus Cloacimonadota bacterium]HNZ06911.1 ABC-type transport auxiliary lipoprotein family protein [Candidatus Cloacimonadota bacterium]